MAYQPIHSLLKRQLKRCLGEGGGEEGSHHLPPELECLLAAIDEAYQESDIEREMLERTLELSSQELFEANSQMRAVFDSIPDLLFRLDLRGVILDYKTGLGNDALLPTVEQQLAGKLIHREVLTQIGDSFLDTLRKVSGDKAVLTIEYTHEHTGSTSYYEIRLTPLLEKQVVAIVRNITDRKRAENERRLIEVQLRNMQKMESIGHLAAGIAHEINTPTQYVGDNTRFFQDSFLSIQAVLQSYSKLLDAAQKQSITPELLLEVEKTIEEADLTYRIEQIPQAISETLEGVDRVTKIVRSMKEFSHPGGKEKAAADLNSAIESTASVARSEWKYVADMKLDLDTSLPAVLCYVGEFNQVILNLIINAAHAITDVVKSSGDKGLITISTRLDGDHVEVRVSDTGSGIPESVQPHIFEPFFTTKDVGKGTGQGLSFAYSTVVQQHGGMISFESEVGKGTTFIVRLPISEAGQSTAQKR